MTKSPDAFRNISEVADWLDTPAHVLRFWESRFSQIKPVKRAGGRRYYRPSDMVLLGGIKKLLHEDGVTIKGVQKILREEGIDYVCAFSPDLDTPVPKSAAKPVAKVKSIKVIRKGKKTADQDEPLQLTAKNQVAEAPEPPKKTSKEPPVSPYEELGPELTEEEEQAQRLKLREIRIARRAAREAETLAEMQSEDTEEQSSDVERPRIADDSDEGIAAAFAEKLAEVDELGPETAIASQQEPVEDAPDATPPSAALAALAAEIAAAEAAVDHGVEASVDPEPITIPSEIVFPTVDGLTPIASGPKVVHSANDYPPEDWRDIEALFYSLKMVRNNMKRTGA